MASISACWRSCEASRDRIINWCHFQTGTHIHDFKISTGFASPNSIKLFILTLGFRVFPVWRLPHVFIELCPSSYFCYVGGNNVKYSLQSRMIIWWLNAHRRWLGRTSNARKQKVHSCLEYFPFHHALAKVKGTSVCSSSGFLIPLYCNRSSA